MGNSGSRGVQESDRRIGVYQGTSLSLPSFDKRRAIDRARNLPRASTGKHFATVCNTFVKGKEALATAGIATKDAHGPLPPAAGDEAQEGGHQ
jgi:hypothetical protein